MKVKGCAEQTPSTRVNTVKEFTGDMKTIRLKLRKVTQQSLAYFWWQREKRLVATVAVPERRYFKSRRQCLLHIHLPLVFNVYTLHCEDRHYLCVSYHSQNRPPLSSLATVIDKRYSYLCNRSWWPIGL
jgi:hypothetical protein